MAVLPTAEEAPEDGGFLQYAKTPLYFLSQPRRAAVVVGNFMKPEILTRQRAAKHRTETAYLDGLRGWAALLVCFVHLAVYTHNDIELCYGHEVLPGVFIDTPAQLPFIRLLFAGGHFSVALFFCISGYVLTQRLIGLLHEDRKDDFVRSIHSSIFRRPLRVFLPVIWSTLMFATLWHVTGLATPWPKRAPNIIVEYWWWFIETSHFLFIFRTGFLFTYYNVHTWTIPVELRGSLFVFVWLFALHHIPHRPRILLTAASVIHLVVLSSGAWYGSFFAGMLTAELHLLYGKNSTVKVPLPWDGFLRALWKRPVFYTILMHLLLVVGLYLASQPTADERSIEETLGHCHGWVTLSKLIPPAYDSKNFRWFWLFWAAWIVMICAREVTWLRRFLESSFSQYLGRNSFALYLTHGPMIGLLSERLFWLTGVWKDVDPAHRGQDTIDKFGHLHNKWHDASWWPFPDGGKSGLEPNFLFCAALSVPVFLYVSELGTKLFDTPSVTASRWIHEKSKRMASSR